MKAISNAFKGVTYHNPQLGESLYELCRRATSRHISGPDEILSQQVVYMINSEMHTPYAAKDASTCLKRRLQMDHPQKQYLAIILTSKVLQECHAALGIYQGELLQEIAYILRTQRSSGPAAARTRQVAMDVLRHFGSAGGDAYRNVRQQGGMPVGPQHTVAATQNRDPAAVAAERESLLDEIKRMVEQASASTEILNELILNKRESQSADGQDDSAGLRRELLADAKELRKLFDMYMSQLAALTGSDAEQAMKSALEAVDQLDNAITLEKDVDAELKDLEAKGQLPAHASAEQPAPAAAAGAGTSAAAAADGAAAAAAAKMQSMNLIDLDDEPAPAAAAAPPPAAAPLDPFAPAAFGNPAPAAAAAAAAAPADPFAPIAAAGSSDPFAPAAAAPAAALGGPVDPFAALAAAPTSAGFTVANGPAAAGDAGFGGMSQPFAQYPDPAAAAADPFVDTTPAWAAAPAAAAAEPAAAGSAGGAAAAPVTTGFDALAAAGPGGSSSTPQQQQHQPVTGLPSVSSGPASLGGVSAGTGGGMSAGGFMPQQQQMQQPGYGTPYGGPTGMGGYGMPYAQMITPQMTGYGMSPYGGMTGQMPGGYYMPQQTGMQGMPGSSPYPSPYPGGPAAAASPYAAQTTGANPYSQPAATAAPAAANPYSMSSGPASTGAYPSLPQQQTPNPTPTSQPEQQQQQLLQPQQQSYAAAAAAPAGGFGLSASNPFATVAPAAGGTANPFGAVAAGATGNVDAEWDKFFKQ